MSAIVTSGTSEVASLPSLGSRVDDRASTPVMPPAAQITTNRKFPRASGSPRFAEIVYSAPADKNSQSSAPMIVPTNEPTIAIA
ncbi:MAG TPA: hypothetical protein VMJ10_00165 [Kofleriaceae bacterium]|nr:hypothetical protein [Kofleriaceae bacterium]